MLAAAREGDGGELSFCWSQVCVLRGQLELASDVFSERTTHLCAWRLRRVMHIMDIFQKPRRLNGDQVPSPPISLSQTLTLPMSLFSRVLALPRRSLPSHEPLSHRVRDNPKNSSKHTCKCSRQSFSSRSTSSQKIPRPLSMSRPKLPTLLSALFPC
jgi:hypothetical protein